MLSKNKTVELCITDLNNLGYGVGRYEGMVVFVSGGVPGDRVLARVIKVTPSYAVARIEEVISPSLDRVENDCGARGCGGCIYRNITYSRELELKRATVEAALRSQGLGELGVAETVSTGAVSEYRNKAQYPIGFEKGRYKIGFYAPKSHRITGEGFGECRLAPAVFEEISRELIALFEKHRPSVYDEESGEGLLRHIYMRRGEVTGEILLVLVINGDTLPHAEEYARVICEKFPDIVGFMLNINKKHGNVICGDRYETVLGRGYIYDELCGVHLKIGPDAFYQVNRRCAELLYTRAVEEAALSRDDTLIDVYCGIGSIGLAVSHVTGGLRALLGVEISRGAVRNAKENAAANGAADYARFYAADASELSKILNYPENANLAKAEGGKLAVLLDPPRAGCSEALIDTVTSLSPERIIYISCNPRTLARDTVAFIDRGYAPGQFVPFDMFPRTGHVECVVCLTRR